MIKATTLAAIAESALRCELTGYEPTKIGYDAIAIPNESLWLNDIMVMYVEYNESHNKAQVQTSIGVYDRDSLGDTVSNALAKACITIESAMAVLMSSR